MPSTAYRTALLLRPAFLTSRSVHAFLLFAVTFGAAALSLIRNRQLNDLGQLTDEWHYLGANLNVSGVLGIEHQPIVLRPPGYPFFIAAALRILSGTPSRLTAEHMERGLWAVYFSQCLVLALTAALLYLWLSSFLRRRIAFACSLAFGLNPYCIVLTGLVHYDVLHMFLLVAGGWALHGALRYAAPRRGPLLLAGAIWGLATLVRPATLLLPPFVLAALLLRWPSARGRALSAGCLFAAALWLIVGPWTARNYVLTGRFIPVNQQSWAAVWGSTVRKLGVHPNHYKWRSLSPDIMQVFSRVTGEREYDYFVYLEYNAALEEAFKEEVLRNLRLSPGVYLDNLVSGFLTFNLDINSVLLKAFQYVQTPGARLRDSWFDVGHPQTFHAGTLSTVFSVYMSILTVLAGGGAWMAWRRKDLGLMAPVTVYLCLAVGHALTYMDLMYYYQRVPFLYVFVSFLGERRPALLEPFLAMSVVLTLWIV